MMHRYIILKNKVNQQNFSVVFNKTSIIHTHNIIVIVVENVISNQGSNPE